MGSSYPEQYLCYGDWEKYSSQGETVENTDPNYHFPLDGEDVVEHTLVMYQYAKPENSSIGHYLGIDSSYADRVHQIGQPILILICMVRKINMKNEVFLDTSYAVALSSLKLDYQVFL